MKYELLGKLGGGGFGAVVLARKHPLGSLVAIKILHHSVDERVRDQLWDEAKLLAAVHHPNIVAVDDLVELPDGRLGLVTEYVEGGDLAELFAAGLEPALAIEVVAEVAAALHAVWTAIGPEGSPLRIVHRDVKPENVRVGRNGEVKLLDFGIARGELPRRGRTWQLAGTLRYMAPERYRLESPHTSDVFSLACVLWRGVTGQGFFPEDWRSEDPFVAHARAPELFATLLDRPALDPLPAPLVELLRDALAWDPDARPTAGAFCERCAELAAVMPPALPLDAWCGQRWPAPAPPAPAPLEAPAPALRSVVRPPSHSDPSDTAEPTRTLPHPPALATPWWQRRALVTTVAGALFAGGASVLAASGLLLGSALLLDRWGCALGVGALCLDPIEVRVTDGLAGGPAGIASLRAVADDARCTVEATPAPSGALRLDGLCPEVSYRVVLDPEQGWAAEPAEVPSGGWAHTQQIRAWRLPPGDGLYCLREGAFEPVESWVPVESGLRFDLLRGAAGDASPREYVHYPLQIPGAIPLIGPNDFLVATGAPIAALPLIRHGALWLETPQGDPLRLDPWVLLGEDLVDGHVASVEAPVDETRRHTIAAGQVAAHYLSGAAVRSGRYGVRSAPGGGVYIVDLGVPQIWRLANDPHLERATVQEYLGIDKLFPGSP